MWFIYAPYVLMIAELDTINGYRTMYRDDILSTKPQLSLTCENVNSHPPKASTVYQILRSNTFNGKTGKCN